MIQDSKYGWYYLMILTLEDSLSIYRTYRNVFKVTNQLQTGYMK